MKSFILLFCFVFPGYEGVSWRARRACERVRDGPRGHLAGGAGRRRRQRARARLLRELQVLGQGAD